MLLPSHVGDGALSRLSLEALSRHSLRFLEYQNLPTNHLQRLHLFLLQAFHSLPNILSLTIETRCDGNLPYSFPRVFQHKGFAQLTFFKLSIPQDSMNNHLLGCLAVGCPSLTHLSLCTSHISDAGMYSLAHGCPLLQFLDVSFCSITDKGIDVLLSKCVDMRQFLVDQCDVKGWGFRHGKRLEKIKAMECFVRTEGLAEGLQGATALRELRLSFIPSTPNLSSIWECCKGLEVLNLKWACTLNDFALGMIMKSCKNLRVLNASWCHYVTLYGWEELARLGKKLEKLNESGCRQFDLECLPAIEEGCPNLRILKLSDHFEFDPSMASFKLSRPAVEVRFDEFEI